MSQVKPYGRPTLAHGPNAGLAKKNDARQKTQINVTIDAPSYDGKWENWSSNQFVELLKAFTQFANA